MLIGGIDAPSEACVLLSPASVWFVIWLAYKERVVKSSLLVGIFTYVNGSFVETFSAIIISTTNHQLGMSQLLIIMTILSLHVSRARYIFGRIISFLIL